MGGMRTSRVLGVAVFAASTAVVTAASPAAAGFTGANGKIIFASDRVHDRELWTMESDGSSLTQLTDNGGFGELYDEPTYSADGQKIVFSRRGAFPGFAIWSMDADGTNQTQLTANPPFYTDGVATWSPDGATIAFMSGRDDPSGEIYVMSSDGSNVTRLTFSSGFDTQPAYSPDGTRIAFESSRDGDNDIYLMDTDGSNVIQLTGTSDAALDGNVEWSPDGQRLAFLSNRNGPFQIFTMDANGANQTSLGVAGAAPEWSPDGTQIAYLQNPGQGEIGIVNADGSNDHTVTMPGHEGYVIDWQPLPASVDTVSALSPVHAWIGLKNGDDQGTKFDVRVELLKNGTPVASGLQRCIVGVTRNPSLATEIMVGWDAFSPVPLIAGDVLALRVSTRIGTNPNDTKCTGPGGSHNNAVGLRLYYDSTTRPSRFDATIDPTPSADIYLHSDGGICGNTASAGVTTTFLDSTASTASKPRCQDSPSINFAGGNPFKIVAVWSSAPHA